MLDLGIEGGTVVTPGGSHRAHVYVAGERIAAVSSERQDAAERVDASGLLVMPGMVDTHVHLMDPAATDREDFPTGSAAAARAGVTTIVEHTHGGPVRTPEDLEEKRRYLRDRSRVDFGLAAHAWPDHLDHVEALWRAGVAFFKVFTCTTHGVPGFDHDHLRRLFERVAAVDGICLVHCEDQEITAEAEAALRAAGREDPGIIPAWRTREAEATAVAGTSDLARRTGCRVVIAHVSHLEVAELAARERAAGAPLRLETCPQYLSFLEEDVLERGGFLKFTPPARARGPDDLDAMWRTVAEGPIDHISTDHAPSTAAQKGTGSIWDVHFGLPGLDTTLAVLLDGAHAGRLAYERVVEVYAEAPARTYGLYPRKGRLAPDADADLVLVDPSARWTVRDEGVVSRAGWSPFSGRTLTGRAVRTYLRGRPIAEDGRVVAPPGAGRFLPGPGAPGPAPG